MLTQKTVPESTAQIIASRALTSTEQKYLQLEREAWACQHFHLYVYGSSFTVATDHKPLEKAFSTPVPSARIERWALQMQNCCPNIVYQPGAEKPSRFSVTPPNLQSELRNTHCARTCRSPHPNDNGLFLHPNAMSLQQIKDSTLADATMTRLVELIHCGKWYEVRGTRQDVDTKFIARCAQIKNELTTTTTTTQKDVILRGHRIVLPKIPATTGHNFGITLAIRDL